MAMYWSAVMTLVATIDVGERGDQRTVGLRLADDRRDQPVEHAGLLDHAAEGERGDDQPDGVEHAVHAAARGQHVHRREAGGRVVAARQREPDALEQGEPGRQVLAAREPDHALRRHEDRQQSAGDGAEEDRGERRKAQHCEHHDQQQWQEQQRRDFESVPDPRHLGRSVMVAGFAQREEHRECDRERDDGRQQRLAYVLVEVDPGGGGRQVGGVGQRRRLVAEVRTRDHRAGRNGRVEFHAGRDAHETDANRADHRPRAADAGGDDGADGAGRHEEVIGAEQLQPVVDHCDQSTAHGPGADQPTHRKQDEDGADAGGDAVRRRLAQRVEAMPAAPADVHRDHGGDHDRDLVRPDSTAIAEQEVRQADQDDQAGNRDDRLEQRQRLWFGRLLHRHCAPLLVMAVRTTCARSPTLRSCCTRAPEYCCFPSRTRKRAAASSQAQTTISARRRRTRGRRCVAPAGSRRC